jgi:hypothetical protein
LNAALVAKWRTFLAQNEAEHTLGGRNGRRHPRTIKERYLCAKGSSLHSARSLHFVRELLSVWNLSMKPSDSPLPRQMGLFEERSCVSHGT